MTDEKRGAIFPVTLSLQAATIDVDGKAIRLSPGMNLTAECDLQSFHCLAPRVEPP